MCVGVCLTRRGMVYFGASIHIFVTFILFIGASVRAFQLTTYEKEDSRKEVLGGFIIATYFFVLLMLGCLIFRATEQKNAKLLGWTGGVFITLETFAFVVNLMILSPMGSQHDEYGFRNFGFTMNLVYIVISCIFLLCMMGYCATIIMYISKLKEDGDLSSSEYDEDNGDAEASSTSNALSRSSSRTASTFFRPQSQNQVDNKSGGGAGGGGGFNILEVVKEAKRQQQLKEQKELREKQKNHKNHKPAKSSSQKQAKVVVNNTKPTLGESGATGGAGGGGGFSILEVVREAKRQQQLKDLKEQKSKTHCSQQSQPQTKPSSRPHTPQQSGTLPKPEKQDQVAEKVEVAVSVKPVQVSGHISQGTQSDSPHPSVLYPHPRPPSRHLPNSFQMRQPFSQDPLGGQPLKPSKSQEQQTQTPYPYPVPQPHPLPNLMPSYNLTQSQTLPPRRIQSQPQQQHHLQFDLDQNRPYFLQEYSQRGILSAPSFASISTNTNTASIVPHRFRNPSAGLRTTKSGTLLNRFDCITPPPPQVGNRVQSLQRMTSSSCSSFDPTLINPNFGLDQWEQPRVQALKGPPPLQGSSNFHYNALRRGTHRSDYGLGVEV